MTTTDALLALLEESEVTADEELATLLADLQALGAGLAPTPGPELAALLVADGRGRRRLHRRGAVIGALVILSLGTGVTAAAASPDVRDGAIGAVAAAVHVLQPPAAVQHRRPAPATTADAPAARSSAVPSAQPSASMRAAVPAVHPSAPGHDGRGTRADDVAHHSTGPSEGRGHDASGSSGSRDGSSSGSGSGGGHGSSGSGSQSSGSGGDGAESGSQHAGGGDD